MTYIEPEDWREKYYMSVRENMAMQEMLAHVLAVHGKPVVINKEQLVGGTFEGKRINIEDDIKSEQFIISLVDENDA